MSFKDTQLRHRKAIICDGLTLNDITKNDESFNATYLPTYLPLACDLYHVIMCQVSNNNLTFSDPQPAAA